MGGHVVHLEPSESVPHPVRGSRLVGIRGTAGFSESSHRVRALRDWLDSQLELQSTPLSLPNSALDLSIFHPTAESRAELFKLARASTDRQLPYWADIWPSGLALGGVALEHAGFLAGKQVLEIGSGLGTTAAATLSTGASVLAVDYTPLALGLCRYNALANVGRSPRTLAINWRNPTRPAITRLAAAGPFPVIMAADVLYESRDIDPLIRLIDRFLAPHGQLWLSEPQRKVSGRFLDTLALRGWRFTSHTEDGPWADGRTEPINIHFLRRELQSDRPYNTLGGWRV